MAPATITGYQPITATGASGGLDYAAGRCQDTDLVYIWGRFLIGGGSMVFRQVMVAVLLFFSVVVVQAGARVDVQELEKSLTRSIPNTTRVNSLITLAEHCLRSKTDFDKAKEYMKLAGQHIEQVKMQPPDKFFWVQARLYEYDGAPMKAIEVVKELISRLKDPKKYQQKAEAWNYYAMLLSYTGDFSESVDEYLKCIAFAADKNLLAVVPLAYQGIAGVYGKNLDFGMEKKYLHLFLEAATTEANDDLVAQANYRLGYSAATVDSNLQVAMQHFRKALAIRKDLNDSLAMLRISNMMGWFNYTASKLDTALRYYLFSVKICPRKNIGGFANPYGNIGTIYRDKKLYDSAMHYYHLCERYCRLTNDFYVFSGLYKDMSDMYVWVGDYKRAYENFVLYKNYSDSVVSRRNQDGLTFARTKFDADSKEKELLVLNLKLAQHRYFIYGAVGLVILALVIGLLLFRQQRMNSARKISEMNNQLSEITHANLRQQMNPHFIFNTLNSIQYFMYQHDKIATNNYLTKFSRLIRKILENSQQSLVSIQDELDVIQLYLELETLRFKEKFTFSIEIYDEIDTLTHKIPAMLIQPFVENSVCHGLMNKPHGGFLRITLRLLQDRTICCSVHDNGIGREAAALIRKTKDTPHHSLGTQITESRISLLNALYDIDMKVVYTDLKDEAGTATGTLVELHLPLIP